MAALTAGSAQAATINLIDQGGVKGSPAQQGFEIAAAYWGRTLTNNVTINLGVGFAPLDPGVIGSTGSSSMDYSVKNWEAGVNATKSNSATDANIVLPTLSGGNANNSGAIKFIRNGPAVAQRGIDTAANKRVYDTETSGNNAINNKTLYLNTANVKAIGGTAVYAPTNTQQLDGEVTFSSTFGFDFNPVNGISAGTFDFIGVAIHEIGHALGFVSGIDFIDYFGRPGGPGKAVGLNYNFNQTSLWSALDMFRYSSDPTNLVAGTGPVLDLSVGVASYFSIDGGLTALYGNKFATGAYNGDGDQTSHWKDASGASSCGPQLGIMDPTFCYGQRGEVTALDLAAFDAIGWNLRPNARGANYLATTKDIYTQLVSSVVPEPTSWAMMIAGFGLVGGTLRRRATRVTFAV